MSRINTNISSLIAQNNLNRNNMSLNTSLQRLSTGLKINSGADNPAGLIASENMLSQEQGITTAIDNANQATNMIGTADGGLGEINNLLTQLQGLVGQAANTGGLSADQVSADQLQVDSILNSINRIADQTSFQGTHLLNGNLDYTTSGVVASQIANVQVNSAQLVGGSAKTVTVNVQTSAQFAKIGYTHSTLASNVTLQIGGNTGTQQISVAAGSTDADIAAAINGVKAATGLSAVVSSDTNLYITSSGYGSKQFVSVSTVSGTFVPSATKATGRDAVVNVNGALASADGLNVNYRSGALDASFTLASGLNTTGGSSAFDITGGGATFSIGSKVTTNGLASLGIQSVSTGSLGDTTNGFLSSLASGQKNNLSSTNLANAQTILDEAVNQVSTLRGRLGAFQNFTLGSTIDSLNIAYENASAAESQIADTDFAAETSNLTRAQILSQSATTVLATANSQPQNILTLVKSA